MTKQNNVLRVAIATMFAVGAGASQAALNSAGGASPAAFTAPKVASEVPTTGVTLTSATNQLTAGTAITNFAPSAGQNLLINVVLSGGAKFVGAPAVLCDTALGTAGMSATLNLGGAGADSGTWTLSSTAYANLTTAASAGVALSACFVSATGLTVTGTHADVGITFNFTYGSLASSTVNGTYVTFARGVTAEVTPAADIVMNVVSGFVTTTAGETLVTAGVVDFKGNGAAMGLTDLNTTIAVDDVINGASGSITVAGAPLVATTAVTGGVYIVSAGAASACNGTHLADAVGGTASVTFSGLATATLVGGARVCLQLDGKTGVPAGSITASVGATAKAGYTLNTAVGGNPLINVTRNGTTLVAPLVQVPSGWLSRLVIANAGPAAAYTVSAISETGNTVTLTGAAASGTAAANSTTVVDLPTLMSATGTNRASFVVTVSGTNANITGLYQIVNSATGALSNYVLVQK